jgi:hypothetical protein
MNCLVVNRETEKCFQVILQYFLTFYFGVCLAYALSYWENRGYNFGMADNNSLLKKSEKVTENDYDGRPTHNRTPAPARTLRAATTRKPNKTKSNHVQPT